mgnify:CR=1 FL=1
MWYAMAKMGIKVKPELDLPTMHGQRIDAVKGLTGGIEFLFKKNKVDYVAGAGRIAGPGKVVVELTKGSTQELATKNILIATGSDVMPLPGVTIDEDRIVSSTGALDLKQVPKHLLVVGAGYIGLEMGTVWRRLGAKVTVVEFLDRITPGMDGEVAKQFQRMLEKQGMKFRLGAKVTGLKNDASGCNVTIEPAALTEKPAPAPLVNVWSRRFRPCGKRRSMRSLRHAQRCARNTQASTRWLQMPVSAWRITD